VEKFVRDADKLELAFQAVEYSVLNEFAIEFAENLEFETEKAKKIYEELMKRRDPRWWR
jgi:putative hydrolase of HD superfamily